MYEIEKGVPCKPWGRWAGTVKEMKPGDSFFVPETDFAPGGKLNTRMAVLDAGRRRGFKMASRIAEGGLRIWRLS